MWSRRLPRTSIGKNSPPSNWPFLLFSSSSRRLWKRSELQKRYFIVLVKDLHHNPSLRLHPSLLKSKKIDAATLENESKKRKHIVFDEEPGAGDDDEKKAEEVVPQPPPTSKTVAPPAAPVPALSSLATAKNSEKKQKKPPANDANSSNLKATAPSTDNNQKKPSQKPNHNHNQNQNQQATVQKNKKRKVEDEKEVGDEEEQLRKGMEQDEQLLQIMKEIAAVNKNSAYSLVPQKQSSGDKKKKNKTKATDDGREDGQKFKKAKHSQ